MVNNKLVAAVITVLGVLLLIPEKRNVGREKNSNKDKKLRIYPREFAFML